MAGPFAFSQGDSAERRSQVSLGPRVPETTGQKGRALYSRSGANPIESIKDTRQCKACADVFAAFSGPPKKRDPTHVKLGETGWAMAQRVFNPQEVWPTKDANTFMVKYLTLVPEQRKEIGSNLVQENFLKYFDKNPSYKASFEFKTKMFASMRSQRTSLVPLLKLTDLVAKVKQ